MIVLYKVRLIKMHEGTCPPPAQQHMGESGACTSSTLDRSFTVAAHLNCEWNQWKTNYTHMYCLSAIFE